ncbi:lasso peptide biosynthesis PqqD family chaperone [Cohnella sp. 56]|uniref:lasso peptide biosynthesis PqqD family chaperone n=1 Tax=Cohnella sp. 56 TaxID=3113722 RepID=UPI0030E8EF66
MNVDMKEMQDADQLVVRSEGNMVSDMNGERVMFNAGTGKYYNLGRIGGRIWDLIASPVGIHRLVDELTAEYEIEREVCEREVGVFLRQLYRESLIEVRSA